ncbi:TetR/AcrR family transcriptional regulator [Sphingorhabdus sp.]|jgi:AcrR family transcriptional regulator|uniref:TetR/AcrR family transcriptional regulator n=1 Tax=Sphingorhabdus sp. TaxID=1902408 RepID=UPI0037CB9760
MAINPTSRATASRPKRAVKREALLDEATRQINMRGAGAVSLNAIAEAAGLSRNTLYYYVSDRADLAFRCYLRTCETNTEDLAIAIEQGSNIRERIEHYIARTLTHSSHPLAVLSDQDFLPEPQRSAIGELNRRNVETLQALINDGIESGQIRAVQSEVAAQALLGMLNWSQLSAMWLGQRDGRGFRRRASAAIADLFFNGIAANREERFTNSLDAAQLITQPVNPFDRIQASQQKMLQLIGAASRLFNRRGLDGASLDEIGAGVGVTKGAVYHYFDDKTDLILRCYERAFELYDIFMDAAIAQGTNGFERSMAVMHLNCQAQASAAPPLMLQPGLWALPEAQRNRFIAAASGLWKRSNAMLQAGVHDGSCRHCDAAMIAEASAGAFLWLPKWLPESYPLSPPAIADQLCDLMAFGVAKR